MIRSIFLFLITIPVLVFSQGNSKPVKLKGSEFNSFPGQFEVAQKVFEHYYDIGFTKKKLNSLNESQKTLCFHFICDGMIGNSGFYSILIETNGEYNAEYLKTLERIGDTTGRALFNEIVTIYHKYEKWFSKQETPPVLVESSKDFDEKLYNRIDELEKKWQNNQEIRDTLFQDYLSKHKSDLVEKG